MSSLLHVRCLRHTSLFSLKNTFIEPEIRKGIALYLLWLCVESNYASKSYQEMRKCTTVLSSVSVVKSVPLERANKALLRHPFLPPPRLGQ